MRLVLLAILAIACGPAQAGPRLPRGAVVAVPAEALRAGPGNDAASQVPPPVQDILHGDPAPGGLLGGGAAPRPVVMPVLPEIPPEPTDENWPQADDRILKEDLPPLPSELGR